MKVVDGILPICLLAHKLLLLSTCIKIFNKSNLIETTPSHKWTNSKGGEEFSKKDYKSDKEAKQYIDRTWILIQNCGRWVFFFQEMYDVLNNQD